MRTTLFLKRPLPHEKMGNIIISFRRTRFYSLFACVCTAFLLTTIYTAGHGLTALLMAIAILALLFMFIYSQLTSKLVLYEYGLCIVRWPKQESLLWSDIAFRLAQCSVIANPNTLMHLILTKKDGKKLAIPNNWKPSTEFSSFIRLLLDEYSPLLNTGARLQKSDIFISAEELPFKENLKMVLSVLGVLFFPIGLGITGLSDLPNQFKAVIIIGSIALIVWLLSNNKKPPNSDV